MGCLGAVTDRMICARLRLASRAPTGQYVALAGGSPSPLSVEGKSSTLMTPPSHSGGSVSYGTPAGGPRGQRDDAEPTPLQRISRSQRAGRTTLHRSCPQANDTAERRRCGMTVLLVIAGAWLGLLLLVLGMLHAATSTPTPRPVSPTSAGARRQHADKGGREETVQRGAALGSAGAQRGRLSGPARRRAGTAGRQRPAR